MCGMSSVATHRMPCMAVHRLRFAGVVHHRLFPFELGAGVYREYAVGYDLFSFGQSFQDDIGNYRGTVPNSTSRIRKVGVDVSGCLT